MINKKIIFIFAFCFFLVGCSTTANTINKNQEKQFNKQNCLGDDCLLVDDLSYPAGKITEEASKALIEAIQDEYKAWATYDKVISKFGNQRPFIMIIRAEEQHIASLKALFDKYGVIIPDNEWLVQAPESLREACSIGVDAEIANAALYRDKLIPAVKDYPDITQVFTNLMTASQSKHLPAFEKCK